MQDEILCTAWIAAEYLRSKSFKDKVYVMGLKESMGEELNAFGIKNTGAGVCPLLLPDYKLEFFSYKTNFNNNSENLLHLYTYTESTKLVVFYFRAPK